MSIESSDVNYIYTHTHSESYRFQFGEVTLSMWEHKYFDSISIKFVWRRAHRKKKINNNLMLHIGNDVYSAVYEFKTISHM